MGLAKREWRGLGLALAEQLVAWLFLGAILGRLEAVAELERLGRKCRIAWDDFGVAVKRSAKPSTAGPNRPVGETGESRKGTLSASISVRFNHEWRSSTTKLAMDLLPSRQWPWASRDARPLTYPGEGGSCIRFILRHRPK